MFNLMGAVAVSLPLAVGMVAGEVAGGLAIGWLVERAVIPVGYGLDWLAGCER
jgi:hypothetical protein